MVIFNSFTYQIIIQRLHKENVWLIKVSHLIFQTSIDWISVSSNNRICNADTNFTFFILLMSFCNANVRNTFEKFQALTKQVVVQIEWRFNSYSWKILFVMPWEMWCNAATFWFNFQVLKATSTTTKKFMKIERTLAV